MATTDETIITRIRHLLALARDAGATQAEAELAMERAQSMLLRHNLDMAQFDAPDRAPEGIGCLDMDMAEAWRQTLVHVLARGNLCQTVRSGPKLSLFGRRDNVRAVVEMYLWLVEQLTPAQLRDQRAAAASDRRHHAAQWWAGAASAIHERLQANLWPERTTSDTRALIVRNETALSEAVRRIYPYTTNYRSSVQRGSAYYSGQAAGRNASLGRPGRLTGGALALPAGR